MRMNVRPGTLAAAVCIVVVGFAIGAWLAIRTRGPVVQSQRVSVVRNTAAAPPVHTAAPRPAATATPAVTPAPTATPAPTERPVSTAAPAAPATAMAMAARPAMQGSWQIDEANVQVGTIRWLGSAEAAGRDTLAINVHKQSVGGRPAVPCERQTVLHATFSLGSAPQTVPYREVNCNGTVSTGDVRVTSFAGDGASFSGNFFHDGVNLGTFSARKL